MKSNNNSAAFVSSAKKTGINLFNIKTTKASEITDGRSFCSYYNEGFFDKELTACTTLQEKINTTKAALKAAKRLKANKAIVIEFEDQLKLFVKEESEFKAEVTISEKKEKNIKYESVDSIEKFLEYFSEGCYDAEKSHVSLKEQEEFLSKVKKFASKHAFSYGSNYSKMFGFMGPEKLTPLAYINKDIEELEKTKVKEEGDNNIPDSFDIPSLPDSFSPSP